MGKNNNYLQPRQYPFQNAGQRLSHPHPAFALVEKGTNYASYPAVHHKAGDMSTSQAH